MRCRLAARDVAVLRVICNRFSKSILLVSLKPIALVVGGAGGSYTGGNCLCGESSVCAHVVNLQS